MQPPAPPPAWPPNNQAGQLNHWLQNPAAHWPSLALRQQSPAPRWLDLCLFATHTGDDASRTRLLTAADAYGLPDADWHSTGASRLRHAASVIFTTHGHSTLLAHDGGRPADTGLPLHLRWLQRAAEVAARQQATERWKLPAQGAQCHLPVLLFDNQRDQGVLAQLTLTLLDEPGAALQLAPAPASALTPLTQSFQQSLDDTTAWLRTALAPDAATAAHNLALAFDLHPLQGTLAALHGPSAGAALALGSAWLLRDHLAPPLRAALKRMGSGVGEKLLMEWPVTAAITGHGQLVPIGAAYEKWLSLHSFAEVLKKPLLAVHVAKNQRVTTPPLATSAALVWHADMAGLVQAIAQAAQPLTPTQQALHDVLVQSDDPPRLRPEALAPVAEPGGICTVAQYALHRWAFWECAAGGQVQSRFVPLLVEPQDDSLRQRIPLPAGPQKGIAQLLIECNAIGTGASGYLLCGAPGAGKTTLLRHFEQALCHTALHQLHQGDDPAELPIYLPLSALPADVQDPVAWLRDTYARTAFPDCAPLHQLLQAPAGRAARPTTRLRLLLDGLNELKVPAGSDRQQRAQQVVQALWQGLAPGLPMLLSTRSHDAVALSDRQGFLVLPVSVLPWEQKDIEAYLAKRFLPAKAALHQQALRDNPHALDLCKTPMHLDGQCELWEAGCPAPLSDRASLYNAWLWQRLRRALQTENGQPVHRAMHDERLLTPADRQKIQQTQTWPFPPLQHVPWQGQLLPWLFQQANLQWRAAAHQGKPTHQRGEVEVAWSTVLKGEPEDLRSAWASAVQDLGLAWINQNSADAFKFTHQSWGEYLASSHLLPAASPEGCTKAQRQALLQDLAVPAFTRSADQELQHQRQQLIKRWQQVPDDFWQSLLAQPITLGWQAVRKALMDQGWTHSNIDAELAFYKGKHALAVDENSDTCTAHLQAWGDASHLQLYVGKSRRPWQRRAEAWQHLLVNRLWTPFQTEVQRRLALRLGQAAVAALWAEQGTLQLPPAGDLDEVAVLAVQGMANPLPWLRWLCLHGHWRLCVRAAGALRYRLEGAQAEPALTADGAVLLHHLRRLLLLRSVASGAVWHAGGAALGWRGRLHAVLRPGGSALASLRTGGVVAALAPDQAPADADMATQWRAAWAAAFKGPGLDLRLRLEAGLLLGELGDTLRYEAVEVPVWGKQSTVLATRLKPAHWVAVGTVGQAARFRIGSWLDRQEDAMPPFTAPLPGFQMAAYPVTVGEWQGFVDAGGYDSPQAPWWQAAGPLAQAWLADRQGLAPGVAVRPFGWRNPRLNNPLQPVTGITAHEARAYSLWAAAHLQADRPDGLTMAVPTELHWEAAVRAPAGQQGRQRWPAVHPALVAGAAPPPLLFNHTHTRWARTSPVGVFSLSNTHQGLADTAGNTWDWCDNDTTADYKGAERQALLGRPSPGNDRQARRGVRGGSYCYPADYCRVAFRYHLQPDNDDGNVGCRLVRV